FIGTVEGCIGSDQRPPPFPLETSAPSESGLCEFVLPIVRFGGDQEASNFGP
ncbi:hypothetical protein J6590_069094, partial [Homalodisca vitripennis]